MYQTADHQIVPMTVSGKPTMPLLNAQIGGFTFDGHRYASDREEIALCV